MSRLTPLFGSPPRRANRHACPRLDLARPRVAPFHFANHPSESCSAPAARPRQGLEQQLQEFLGWFAQSREDVNLDPLLRAGIAHFWFVTLHPFDDGNGAGPYQPAAGKDAILAAPSRHRLERRADESAQPFARWWPEGVRGWDQCQPVSGGGQGVQGHRYAALGLPVGEELPDAAAGWGAKYSLWAGARVTAWRAAVPLLTPGSRASPAPTEASIAATKASTAPTEASPTLGAGSAREFGSGL